VSAEFHVTWEGNDGERWEETVPNGITDEGLTALLASALVLSQAATWKMGLIYGSGGDGLTTPVFSAVAATDTSTSHPGWARYGSFAEVGSSTSHSTSPAFSVSGTTVTMSSPLAFTMNTSYRGNVYIRGIFLITQSPAGLWSTGLFSSARQVGHGGGILTVKYSCSAAAGITP